MPGAYIRWILNPNTSRDPTLTSSMNVLGYMVGTTDYCAGLRLYKSFTSTILSAHIPWRQVLSRYSDPTRHHLLLGRLVLPCRASSMHTCFSGVAPCAGEDGPLLQFQRPCNERCDGHFKHVRTTHSVISRYPIFVFSRSRR